MEETWKAVPELDGEIEVSNTGRARSWRNGKYGLRDEPKEILTSSPKKSYKMIQYGNKPIYLHRAIAKLFIGNPEGKKCVNHKDGNKLNNHVDNLEWVTKAENNKHGYENLLMGREKKSSLNRSDVLEIRDLWDSTDLTQREIANKFNISRTSVNDIVNRYKWKHI